MPRLVETAAEIHDRLGLAYLEADRYAPAREQFDAAFKLNKGLGFTGNLASNRRSASIAAYGRRTPRPVKNSSGCFVLSRDGFTDADADRYLSSQIEGFCAAKRRLVEFRAGPARPHRLGRPGGRPRARGLRSRRGPHDPHLLVVLDLATPPAVPPVPVPGVTVVLPLARDPGWPATGSSSPGRHQPRTPATGTPRALRGGAGAADRCGPAAAEAAARRLAPYGSGPSGSVPSTPAAPDPVLAALGLPVPDSPSEPLAAPCRHRPVAGGDRDRPARTSGPPRPQGGRARRHRSARSRGRGHRVRQVRAAAHPRARPGRHALPGRPQPGAGRLQGRRDVHRAGGAAAHLGADHEPRRRGGARRADGRRAVRGAPAASGGAPRHGALHLPARPRGRPCRLRRPGLAAPAALAPRGGRRVLRAAHRRARLRRPLRGHRSPGPLAGRAPAAGLAAARRGTAARARVAPVLPRRPAHLQRRRVARGAGRARRGVAARRARRRLPAHRAGGAGAVHRGVRLRAGPRRAAAPGARTGGPAVRRALPGPFGRRGPRPRPRPRVPDPGRGPPRPAGPTLLESVVDRLAGHGPPAHQVWLPPLDAPARPRRPPPRPARRRRARPGPAGPAGPPARAAA